MRGSESLLDSNQRGLVLYLHTAAERRSRRGCKTTYQKYANINLDDIYHNHYYPRINATGTWLR